MFATLTTAAAAVLLIYVGFCVLLYVSQERMLFYPGPNDPVLLREWAPRRVEISTHDSVLEGWWTEDRNPETDIVILYFGGNAEDVLYALSTAHQLGAGRVFAANYRGYGKTKGQPSQAALFADGLTLYDYVAAHPDVAGHRIVVMGRSLGSGVATHVAAHRKVSGAILITPYDSVAAIAQKKFPFAPVRWLLKHPFPSDRYAPKIEVPALMIGAEYDQVVPVAHARALYIVWGGQKSLHVLPRTSHNNVEQHPDYFRLVQDFLISLPRA